MPSKTIVDNDVADFVMDLLMSGINEYFKAPADRPDQIGMSVRQMCSVQEGALRALGNMTQCYSMPGELPDKIIAEAVTLALMSFARYQGEQMGLKEIEMTRLWNRRERATVN